MAKFTITTHKFTLDNEEYFLKPLTGEYLTLLFKVMAEAEGIDESTGMSPEGLKDMHTLASETLKQSYPDYEASMVEAFVTKNLFVIFGHIISANINVPDKKE